MRKPGHYLSGRVKANSPSDVANDRYDFLKLEDAEPNLGTPPSDNGIPISSALGVRDWATLGAGISLNANNELFVAEIDVANLEVTITQNIVSNTDLQQVTDVGASTTNAITTAGLNLTQNAGIVFEGQLNDVAETTLRALGPPTDVTISLPSLIGDATIITTRNLFDIGQSLGGAFYGNDSLDESSYDYIVHTSQNNTLKLTPADAIAGLVLVDEAIDASQNEDYNLVMIQTEAGAGTTGSTTTPRALMVDSGGVRFNPSTNQFTGSGALVATTTIAAGSGIYTTANVNTPMKLAANGTGNIQILKPAAFGTSLITLDEGENGIVYNANNDAGNIIKYNTAANTAATALQVGVEYQIIFVGDTIWTSVGAPNNIIGTVFTATGAGTGTGVAVTTSSIKKAFYGWDRSTNRFKWVPDASVTGDGTADTVITGVTGDAEFNNLYVTGDIVQNGNTVIFEAETLSIEDPIIFIGNSNNSVDDNLDRGIVFNYNDGDPKQGFMGWDDSEGKFVLYGDGTESGGVYTPALGIFSRAGLQVKEFESSNATELCKYSASIAAVTIGRVNTGGKFTFANPNPQGMKIATSSSSGTTDLTLETDTNHRIHLDSSNSAIRFDVSDERVLTLGETETVINNTLKVEDPIIFIGNSNNSVDDNIDRGIVFNYNDPSAIINPGPKQGFMGWDDNEKSFVLFDDVSESNGIITKNPFGEGDLLVNGINARGASTLAFASASLEALTVGGNAAKFVFNTSNRTNIGISTATNSGATNFTIENNQGQSIVLDGANSVITATADDLRISGGSLTIDDSAPQLKFVDTDSGTSVFNQGSIAWYESDGTTKTAEIGKGLSSTNPEILHIDNLDAGASILFSVVPTGETSVTYALEIDDSGQVKVLTTTDSTSDTTGALIVDGGVGIDKNLNVGGNSKAANFSATDAMYAVNGIQIGGTDLSNMAAAVDIRGSLGQAGQNLYLFMDDGALEGTAYDGITIGPGSDYGDGTVEFKPVSTPGGFGSVSDQWFHIKASVVSGTTNHHLRVDGDIENSGDITTSGIFYSDAGIQVGNTSITSPAAPVDIRGSGEFGIYLLMSEPSTSYDGITFRPGSDYGNGTVEILPTSIPGAGTTNQWLHIKNAVSAGTTKHNLRVDGDIELGGELAATQKSFLINHPTKEGMRLRHGSLEGPENGVYVRGRLKGNNIIELPDYWLGLVDEDTITVELTPVGKYQKLFVKDIASNAVLVGNDNLLSKTIDCFYTVYGERKDIDKLVVEFEK